MQYSANFSAQKSAFLTAKPVPSAKPAFAPHLLFAENLTVQFCTDNTYSKY